MASDIEKIKLEMKKKRDLYKKSNEDKKNGNIFYKFGIKVLIVLLLTVSTLIILKKYPNLKGIFYKEIYENNISFTSINNFYKKIFGNPIPFSEYFESKINPVFDEKLSYYKLEEYNDGIKLIVDNNYLVPVLENGMVVFVGNKENYPNTIIVEQVNGIDVWYSNIENINVNLYDYVDKGFLLGSTINNQLNLVFKKNGEIIDYNDYI